MVCTMLYHWPSDHPADSVIKCRDLAQQTFHVGTAAPGHMPKLGMHRDYTGRGITPTLAAVLGWPLPCGRASISGSRPVTADVTKGKVSVCGCGGAEG